MILSTTKELKAALLVASKQFDIPILEARIKIACPKGDGAAQYFILRRNTEVGEMTLKKLLGIGIVDLFQKEAKVTSFMNVALGSLAFKNQMPLNKVNIRIYTKDADNGTPLLTFLKNDEVVQHLTVEDIFELYQEYEEEMQKMELEKQEQDKQK